MMSLIVIYYAYDRLLSSPADSLCVMMLHLLLQSL